MYHLIRSRESFPNPPTAPKPDSHPVELWGQTNVRAFQTVYGALGPLAVEQREIRLLSLAPGQQNDPIRCALRTASLLADPTFEALSYCWGEAGELQQSPANYCYVNDEAVRVLPNLYSALRDIRQPDVSRDLWVDYLCINQSDTPERNTQVRLMGAIYSQAKQVLCYVGEAGDDCDAALDHLRAVAVEPQLHLNEHFADRDADSIDRRAQALEQFMRRPWFYRIWTVQEVVLSQSALLICGNQSISWSLFRTAAEYWGRHVQCCMLFLNLHTSVSDAFFAFYKATNRCIDALSPSCTLCDLVQHLVWCAATDPRDHIYGLLSLLTPAQRLVQVDYHLPQETVFRHAALGMMRTETQAWYLTNMFCGLSHPRIADRLPSWVADFANLEVNFFFKRAVPLFNAYGAHDEASFQQVDENTISYEGVLVDTVAVVDTKAPASNIPGGMIMGQPDAKHLFDHLVNAEQMATHNEAVLARYAPAPDAGHGAATASTTSAHEEDHHEPSPVYEAVWRALAFGVMDTDFISPRHLEPSDLATYQAARRALAAFAASPPDTSPMGFFQSLAASSVFAYALTFTGVACSTRFFITQQGYIGMGPHRVQVGDTVAILRGGPIPFILRAKPKTGTDQHPASFELLGGAYLEGGMNGEMVSSVESDNRGNRGDTGLPADRTWQRICLC